METDMFRSDEYTLKNVRFREVCIYNTEWDYARPCYHWKKQRQGIMLYRPDNRKFRDCAYNVMCKDVSGWNRWGEHTANYCQNCKFYGGLVFGGQVRCMFKDVSAKNEEN